MRDVQCLYFEDEEEARFTPWLKRAWGKRGTYVPISVTVVTSAEEAERELSRGVYNLFVVDVYLGSDDKHPIGLHLIDQARSADDSVAIVALSRADQSMVRRTKDAGADEFISKQAVIDDPSLSNLGEAMVSALRARRHEPVPTEDVDFSFDRDNLPLTAIVETIGRSNIIALVFKLLHRRCERIVAKYVSPGLSGALVLALDCDLLVDEGNAPDLRQLLLKVGRDRFGIENELAKRREAQAFPSDLFLSFGEGEVVDSGGWYALGSPFHGYAVTMLDWLKCSPARQDIHDCLEALFLTGGLNEVYRRGIRVESRPNVALWNVLTIGRRARVRLAVDELGILAERRAPDAFKREILLSFINAKRIGLLDEEGVPSGTWQCRCHGDLHGRNVLVDSRGNPRLIDPASIHQSHWAIDAARLGVDLVLSGWDRGSSSHEWEGIDEWLSVCAQLLGIEKAVQPSDENRPVLDAVGWFRSRWNSLAPQKGEAGKAEFQLALGVEFMRSAYRFQDLSGPKRVLGLAAACMALREAESCWRG